MDTQYTSHHVLNKPLPWKRGHKMYINFTWPNHSHANDYSNCISSCVDQTPPMPASESQHGIIKLISCQRGYKKISTYVDQTHHTPGSTLNVYQLVLSKLNPRQREYKMHLNVCWPIPSHAREDTRCISICWPNSSNVSEDTKCISTCVYQTHPMPGNK
jgi:hypothetical protein